MSADERLGGVAIAAPFRCEFFQYVTNCRRINRFKLFDEFQ